ncbi:hypothetical protein, partial [Escherichia coli]|uniref:hypothetical protein n=1 Tax=Escherichia coli TaxID=562 RepID=UPI003D798E28
LTFQNHTNRPLTDFGGKTSIFSHPVYLFLREFSLQDFRGGSYQQYPDARLRAVEFSQQACRRFLSQVLVMLLFGQGQRQLMFWGRQNSVPISLWLRRHLLTSVR